MCIRDRLLRAVARGAWVVTPEWVTASAEAGRWVEETPYETQHFPGAKRARDAHGGTLAAAAAAAGGAVSKKTLLLNGMRVCVQERSSPPSVPELKQLITAAGGEVAPRAKVEPSTCIYIYMLNSST